MRGSEKSDELFRDDCGHRFHRVRLGSLDQGEEVAMNQESGGRIGVLFRELKLIAQMGSDRVFIELFSGMRGLEKFGELLRDDCGARISLGQATKLGPGRRGSDDPGEWREDKGSFWGNKAKHRTGV
ncbi:hypothetical protein NDU88_004019 [Pleurodeles waltl]|uniref:Resolvase/invertase-type recombinase catalytic domain-containing protein n=1 Tax=Pleurodeles waltl TaxID=8319 RepID=A0AAV7WTW5_PLEWA|nr:hypothetical protein NDU88_004019 [Pleurodeles waltl]